MAEFDQHIVSAHWLKSQHGAVKLLDATWVMPGQPPPPAHGYIPGAQIFDLDEVAASHPTLKHMLPSAAHFARAVGAMGISETDHVVCYDRQGVRSSPRLWWTFQMFGHEKVSVLDGGLPAWIEIGGELASAPARRDNPVSYRPLMARAKAVDLHAVRAAIGNGTQIIDARSVGRFLGRDPEPRPGLRSGHMPGSINIPYSTLLDQDGKFSASPQLAELFKSIDLSQPIITSCGSGITAASLALALKILGASDVSLYDGSWTEYAAKKDAQITTGHATVN